MLKIVGVPLFVLCLSLCLLLGQVHSYKDDDTLTALQQVCSAYAPQSCQFQPKIVDGEYDYGSYTEIFPNETHTCSSVDVRENSYEWTNPSTGIKLTIEESFCNFNDLETGSYRLQKNTGLPLGKLEDRYAKCITDNLNLRLLVSNCRDLKLWTCDDCLSSYKKWACTQVFKRCTSGSNPSNTDLACRDTCFNVVRKCPANIEFTCRGSDPRDYSDALTCYTL